MKDKFEKYYLHKRAILYNEGVQGEKADDHDADRRKVYTDTAFPGERRPGGQIFAV